MHSRWSSSHSHTSRPIKTIFLEFSPTVILEECLFRGFSTSMTIESDSIPWNFFKWYEQREFNEPLSLKLEVQIFARSCRKSNRTTSIEKLHVVNEKVHICSINFLNVNYSKRICHFDFPNTESEWLQTNTELVYCPCWPTFHTLHTRESVKCGEEKCVEENVTRNLGNPLHHTRLAAIAQFKP